jgi:hypothetical protein
VSNRPSIEFHESILEPTFGDADGAEGGKTLVSGGRTY